MSEEGLLEKLASQRGCFLSSLREPGTIKKVLQELWQTDPELYSLDEWGECLSYLLKRDIHFQSKADLMAFWDKMS